MHNTKEFNKVMSVINKHSDFETKKIGRKTTIKITHRPTLTSMTTHNSAKAYHPIRRWLKKFDIIL